MYIKEYFDDNCNIREFGDRIGDAYIDFIDFIDPFTQKAELYGDDDELIARVESVGKAAPGSEYRIRIDGSESVISNEYKKSVDKLSTIVEMHDLLNYSKAEIVTGNGYSPSAPVISVTFVKPFGI